MSDEPILTDPPLRPDFKTVQTTAILEYCRNQASWLSVINNVVLSDYLIESLYQAIRDLCEIRDDQSRKLKICNACRGTGVITVDTVCLDTCPGCNGTGKPKR